MPKQYDSSPELTIDLDKTYTATLDTNHGEVVIELDAARSPQTVNNFVFLAREGFYDDSTFHRVLPNFMAQGGDPTGTGSGGPGYRFDDEPVSREYLRGTLAMANAGANTNGSQFFITFAATAGLAGLHTIFGEVVGDEGVLSAITLTGQGPDTIIESIRIIEG